MSSYQPRHARDLCPHHRDVMQRLAKQGNHPHTDLPEVAADLARCGECSGRVAGEGLGRER